MSGPDGVGERRVASWQEAEHGQPERGLHELLPSADELNEEMMITLPEAKKLAIAALCKMSGRNEADLAFVDALTSCKSYGWILFYNSRQFVETGNELEAFGGNGPVVVLHDGAIHFLGSDREGDVTIAAFEREHGF
jgi:hypothetical protein